ncbi:MAG: hypothetical protein COA79_04490 [Planctomycetota bacterium]|nr:MAG: hypothetical protein COA79_04490 [Planctomycetota bacterium]
MNQNTDKQPWGGMKNSSDQGRFVYEYYPAKDQGRAAGVWAQALGIMALGAANLGGKDLNWWERDDSIKLAAKYMCRLQVNRPDKPASHGGFCEHTPGDMHSYPRDAATGGIGLAVLHHITKEDKFIDMAKDFCHWYRDYGSAKDGWPHITYDLEKGEGINANIEPGLESNDTSFIRGDWQAGGGLAYYYLGCISGERKYIDDYFLPLIDQLVILFEKFPYTEPDYGFHGSVPVSFGNDDFALVALLCAYVCTKDKKYYEIAKGRIDDFEKYWDEESGSFPSFGGTFTSGITLKVIMDIEEKFELCAPSEKYEDMIKRIAEHGLGIQAFDYNNVRVHGGFWGQTEYGVSKDRIHHRSTGYASIFYSMLGSKELIPYYHALGWDVPEK